MHSNRHNNVATQTQKRRDACNEFEARAEGNGTDKILNGDAFPVSVTLHCKQGDQNRRRRLFVDMQYSRTTPH